MSGRRIGIALFALFALVFALRNSGDGSGFNYSAENGMVTVSASSSPLALVMAVLLIVAFVLGLEGEQGVVEGPVAGAGARGLAWFTDFMVGMCIVAPMLALAPLAREAALTGEFAWSFERHTATTGDWALGFPLALLMLALLGVYWSLPVLLRGQTVGQAIFGIRVVALPGSSLRGWRCFLRGVAQPFTFFNWVAHFFTHDGSYPLDRFASVRVLTLRSSVAPPG